MPERKPAASTEELASKPQDAEPTPPHDDIARLAYALWQERGGPEGDADRDWFEAERQLRESKVNVQAA